MTPFSLCFFAGRFHLLHFHLLPFAKPYLPFHPTFHLTMPPRCEDRSSDVSDFGHTKSGTAPLTKGVVPSQHVAAAKQRPRAPRKHKGNLRFGVHGWSGVASTALTSAAALVAHHNSEPSRLSSMLSLCAAMTASISASSGVPLIGQAPVRTVISKNVIVGVLFERKARVEPPSSLLCVISNIIGLGLGRPCGVVRNPIFLATDSGHGMAEWQHLRVCTSHGRWHDDRCFLSVACSSVS